jgi:hypothetical protein
LDRAAVSAAVADSVWLSAAMLMVGDDAQAASDGSDACRIRERRCGASAK